MNAEDRFQAILRHPAYRNDWRFPLRRPFELFQSGKSPTEAEIIAHPWAQSEAWVRAQYGSFITFWGLSRAVEPESKEEVAGILQDLRTGDASIFTKLSTDVRTTYIFAGNLERPLGEEAKRALREMEAERKKRGITEKRTKPNSVDRWLVWDAMQTPGSNLVSITRSLFDVPAASPAYDGDTRRPYESVKRAYEKACAMIEDVGRHLYPGYDCERYVRDNRHLLSDLQHRTLFSIDMRASVRSSKPWGV
jgi:hypothetical protein